jgi:hypothetical protein
MKDRSPDIRRNDVPGRIRRNDVPGRAANFYVLPIFIVPPPAACYNPENQKIIIYFLRSHKLKALPDS